MSFFLSSLKNSICTVQPHIIQIYSAFYELAVAPNHKLLLNLAITRLNRNSKPVSNFELLSHKYLVTIQAYSICLECVNA